MKKGFNLFGFTLVETIISIAIFAVISAVIYLFFMVGIGSWEIGTATTELQARARHAMDAMIEELKQATRDHDTRGITILPPPNNSEIIFYLPQKDAQGDVVIGLDGEIQWPVDDTDFIKYEFLPDSNQLVRRQGDQQKVLANNVSSAQFIDAGIDGSLFLDEVNILLNLQKVTPRQRSLSFNMRSTVKLRN